ncbi:bifunctional oligoribonuclease/PAP phosphatase NrnA [Mesomycoplasma hyopneumoniae]|uniref:DHH family phosphoesterase n=1 Tax=Mesomycoplasma hyopneumoniae (strain 7448) TaxID=262722 RepID=Q4A906_MESH7|nr:bifunctional oligoribonuclease/PAP phosphatase NrnA [Mesomycoplasma hyopneumoniae]AAZ53383.2 DHH family phosphoesterase [Mesomycoplasma hyopneumoniae 7448]AGQ50616.1 DHH family phosphoesterase [Mesomycoplasma hyopneumoniae 7422]
MSNIKIKEIIKLIENHDTIVIFHHIRPDGDCIGAQLGLKNLILDNFKNKKVFAVGNHKGSFSFLNAKTDSIPDKLILKNSLAIIVDANFKNRIESVFLFDQFKFKTILRIDHHPNEDDFEQIYRWVDPSYVATCEQIADLAYKAKWKISQKSAIFIYLGIYTDSGRFLYKNTSARTHFLTGILFRTGFNFALIHEKLNQKKLSDIDFDSYIFSVKKIYKNVIFYTLSMEEQKKLNKNPSNSVRPNLLANIENFRIWLCLVQEKENSWRVEFRSSGPNVQKVAQNWGGGGHLNASGAIIESLDKLDLLIKDCQAEYESWFSQLK